jgi:uncharacterized membrane protein
LSTPNPTSFSFSKHRLEGLTDGIFAVAMTLLVIELKVPESSHINSQDDLINAVGHLLPKFIAWFISFFVLAQFWYGNHRLFHFVRHVNGKFAFLTLAYLGFISLVPFSSALVGDYQPIFFSQVFYSINLGCLALMSLSLSRYVFTHPEVSGAQGMPPAVYHGARLRNLGLLTVAIVSVITAYYFPRTGNVAFALMIVFSPLSRRMEARELAQSAHSHPTQEDSIA